MNDREAIFGRIRAALAPLPQRTPLPNWEPSLAICKAQPDLGSLKALFAYRLKAINGTFAENIPHLAELLRKENALCGYCDPALLEHFRGPEFAGIEFHTRFDVAQYETYRFGITRASAAIAESGTVMLRDADTSSRLAALSPWIHVAVVEEKNLLEDLQASIKLFGTDPNVIWITGPSKTADVEGILIEGVHGPGIQIVLIV